jgi:hypothetical protein
MAEAALVMAPLDVLEAEIQEALNICGGDPMKALRITLTHFLRPESNTCRPRSRLDMHDARRPDTCGEVCLLSFAYSRGSSGLLPLSCKEEARS